MEFIRNIEKTIRRHNMLSYGDSVIVSLSGGPDSVCLLHILNALRTTFNLSLRAVYIEHGLRPEETPAEISFCSSLCKDLRIDFAVRDISPGSSRLIAELGLQGAARELRYAALEEEAHAMGASRIALGHHKNDQAETLLINLLRGSGMTGLRGIPPVRGNVIRPLIEVEKEEIIAYLSAYNIGYMTDSSNLKDEYLRNRIRSRLIPELMQMNPGITDTLCRTAEVIRQENDYLETVTTEIMPGLTGRKTGSHIELFLKPLECMPTCLLRRVLRRTAVETKGLRTLSFQNIEDIISLIKRGKSGDRIHLRHGVRVMRDYTILIITSEKPLRLKSYSLSIGDTVLLEEAEAILTASREQTFVNGNEKNTAIFDLSKVAVPLTIRARREGDFFYPSGFGKRKKLQDFFVDEKIPRDERDVIPIICSNDNIIWVFGHRADQRFLPDENTIEYLVVASRSIKKQNVI